MCGFCQDEECVPVSPVYTPLCHWGIPACRIGAAVGYHSVNLCSAPSVRLTAFVLKSFSQSRGFIFIDPEELQAAKAWLIRHQREEGSFPAMGRILNKDLQVLLGAVKQMTDA